MITIFDGEERGPGKRDKTIFAKLDVDFREIIHLFKGPMLPVFLCISLHIDSENMCFPSYDTLERETGLSRSAISNALKKLCKLKIDGHTVLAKTRQRDDEGKFAGSNLYEVFQISELEWSGTTVAGKALKKIPLKIKGKPSSPIVEEEVNTSEIGKMESAVWQKEQRMLQKNAKYPLACRSWMSVFNLHTPKDSDMPYFKEMSSDIELAEHIFKFWRAKIDSGDKWNPFSVDKMCIVFRDGGISDTPRHRERIPETDLRAARSLMENKEAKQEL